MLTCKDVCENATDYLEGSASPFQRVLLRIHLIMCRNCRRFLGQFKIMVDASPALLPVDAPSEEEISLLVQKLKQQSS
jgi:predicted anti-sigma-YlaC factor YlaD